MRRPFLPFLLAPLLLLPGAAAHAEVLEAGEVFTGTLPPGAEERFGLAPPTGPLPAGLLIAISAIAYNGSSTPEISLQLAEATLFTWKVAPGQVTRNLAAVTPEPGNYVLALRNPGPRPVRVGFFYDLACDCANKSLPVAVPNGVLVFALDTTPGKWAVNVSEPPVHRLLVDVATVKQPGPLTWPEGFAIHQESTPGATQAEHRLPWAAPEGGRFYLVARSARADVARLDLGSPEAQNQTTLVATRYERTGDAPKVAPGPEALAVLVALAGLAAAARRGPRNG